MLKTNVIIDWISVTVKDGRVSPSDWTNELTIENKGMLGYPVKAVYADGRIELSNPSRPDMGTHVIYSGSTLRGMESRYGMEGDEVLKWHATNDHKFTRIDIAVDVFDGFTAKEAIERYENKECVSPMRRADKVQSINGKGDTLYIGRRGGDRMVRIYDKSAQTNTSGVWTRTEGEFRAFGALSLVRAIRDAKDWRKEIISVLRGVADFPEWKDWTIAMSEKAISLEIERKVTSSTEHWLISKVAPSLAKFSVDHTGFLDKFIQLTIELMSEQSE